MALRCFRKEIVLAGFSAETQAPMVVVDETKLSPTVCTAVFQLGHETLHRFGGCWHHASDMGYRVCLAGSRPLGRGGSKVSLKPALTMWSLPYPRPCLAPPILCYFGPTDCNLPQYSRAGVGNGQTREGSDEGSARQSRISLLVEGNIDPCQKLSGQP